MFKAVRLAFANASSGEVADFPRCDSLAMLVNTSRSRLIKSSPVRSKDPSDILRIGVFGGVISGDEESLISFHLSHRKVFQVDTRAVQSVN